MSIRFRAAALIPNDEEQRNYVHYSDPCDEERDAYAKAANALLNLEHPEAKVWIEYTPTSNPDAWFRYPQ